MPGDRVLTEDDVDLVAMFVGAVLTVQSMRAEMREGLISQGSAHRQYAAAVERLRQAERLALDAGLIRPRS